MKTNHIHWNQVFLFLSILIVLTFIGFAAALPWNLTLRTDTDAFDEDSFKNSDDHILSRWVSPAMLGS